MLYLLSSMYYALCRCKQQAMLERLCRRGPDHMGKVTLPLPSSGLQLDLLGTVLHMRGPRCTPQPLASQAGGDCLLWNGNVFGGDLQVGTDCRRDYFGDRNRLSSEWNLANTCRYVMKGLSSHRKHQIQSVTTVLAMIIYFTRNIPNAWVKCGNCIYSNRKE